MTDSWSVFIFIFYINGGDVIACLSSFVVKDDVKKMRGEVILVLVDGVGLY